MKFSIYSTFPFILFKTMLLLFDISFRNVDVIKIYNHVTEFYRSRLMILTHHPSLILN
jgi:hypothetical protein